MPYFLILGVTTVIALPIVMVIWFRTRFIGFPLGIYLIYFLTLQGAWFVVQDQSGGDSGLRYHYLFQKLFIVQLDFDYAVALVLYSLFFLSILVALLALVRRRPRDGEIGDRLIVFSHYRVLALAVVALALSGSIFGPQLVEAFALGASGYRYTRLTEVSNLFTIAAILNRAAILPLSLGFAALITSRDPRFLVGKQESVTIWVGYLVLITVAYGYAVLLGNKNELLHGAVTGLCLYALNKRSPGSFAPIVIGFIVIVAISVIDVLRGYAAANLADALEWETLVAAARVPFQSNEMFGAHFSMYGALHFDVPLTYGFSFISLLASVVPRILWPDRPYDIYVTYAEGVNALEGQGYSIHHATGWFLNFGAVGVLVGGLVLGLIWAWLYNNAVSRRPRGLAARLAFIVFSCTFVGGLAPLMRSGIEGYKGLMIDSFLVPTAILLLAVVRRKKSIVPAGRPSA